MNENEKITNLISNDGFLKKSWITYKNSKLIWNSFMVEDHPEINENNINFESIDNSLKEIL